MILYYGNFTKKIEKMKKLGEKTKMKEKLKYSYPNQRLRACLAMFLKFDQFRGQRAYKLRAYKKKEVYRFGLTQCYLQQLKR